MSDQLKSIGFSALVALVCSLLLTGAATGLKERKMRNVALDRQKNILMSVGLVDPVGPSTAAQIEQSYRNNIRCYAVDGTGRIVAGQADADALPVCFYVKDSEPAAYILPVDSRGLWGTIRGYMAIENDGETVAGFSVYSHNETPGLGGEIEKPWFQQNFVGKKIVDASGRFSAVGIAKGKVADAVAEDRQVNFVDGISGATLTGKFLTGGLKDVLLDYEPLAEQFRAGPVALPSDG
ncbi:Na(+)-translocating NADH-quinone reductase subunit C [Desulfosarcina alkanivorans]|uniref:Na(+)-translocating NADH-quinone reductase subunit C n=1 Tax=Desulfosarcina alkanivorans TaxID=571177 RepID=A0A5K7YL38_9BACT|nr:FMN-binding protein [Desulfosarcina alkanivorans]BBO68890.1 Na(+)-translocating NADH-quinone reductase subunit C [Desulfosarcina alkanivorans]